MRAINRSLFWALTLLALITCPLIVRATIEEKSDHATFEDSGDDIGPEDYETYDEADFEGHGKQDYGPPTIAYPPPPYGDPSPLPPPPAYPPPAYSPSVGPYPYPLPQPQPQPQHAYQPPQYQQQEQAQYPQPAYPLQANYTPQQVYPQLAPVPAYQPVQEYVSQVSNLSHSYLQLPVYQPAQTYAPLAPVSNISQSYQQPAAALTYQSVPAYLPQVNSSQSYQQPAYQQQQQYQPVPLPYQTNYTAAPLVAQYLEPIAYVPPYTPQEYIQPIEVYTPNYTAPAQQQSPQYQQTQPAYVPAPVTPPQYVAPAQQIIGPHYTPPVQAPRVHQQQVHTSNYSATSTPTAYRSSQQVSNYTVAKPQAQVQVHQQVQAPVQPQIHTYVRPQIQSHSQPQQQSYVQPQQQSQTQYRPQAAVATPAYNKVISQVNSLAQAIKSYLANELVSLVAPTGYRSNHWSLQYYTAAPYRQCPQKNAYLAIPSYRDVEAAFIYARSRLESSRAVQTYNATQASYAARHQIFSLMSQVNTQMDEEGLLLELVSHYLADRACLTKWDRQRYLPSLTKFVSSSNFPATHSCSAYYRNEWQARSKYCSQSKYRTFDGFCNNPYHPYWGKSNVCHIRLLSPDYADGISAPRNSYNYQYPLPNPRSVSNYINNDIPLEGPYNLMKMQWGQFINHDISNTALSSYEGLVDCCKQPGARGCWPIFVPPGDKFYGPLNVTCLNFIRSGVCPLCQLGPRQQINKNTAFLDLSLVYGNTLEQSTKLRAYQYGLLRTSTGKNGEVLLPIASSQEQCHGQCFQAGDPRVNQHPALTVLHTLLLRNHNRIAEKLRRIHPTWNDEYLFQEARRINIAEYQMITFNEYLPIVFGPILSAYYKLYPLRTGHTYFEPKVDPTTWNEYTTASCRFGHSQIQSTFGLYSKIYSYGQHSNEPTFRLKDWFMRPSLLSDGLVPQIVNGLLARPSQAVDPWITNDVRNHLYQSHKEYSGGDLAATNIWRGRDHGLPGYVHYVEYCFNYKVRTWKDLSLFIPYYTLNNLRRLYKTVENIDLFAGGLAERHFPGADIGPTFACINGIQYYHLKFGDRFYFEHGGQPGSFNQAQLSEIRRSTLARMVCLTSYVQAVPQYAFLPPSQYNPLVNCSQFTDMNYGLF